MKAVVTALRQLYRRQQASADGTDRRRVGLALGQGVFYLATGVWPLVSFRTFERVTGPKTDRWLVKTVGVLVTVIGMVLLVAGRRRQVSDEVVLLAVGSAAGLASIDTIYRLRGRIATVYLLDALVELVLVGGWLRAGWRQAPRSRDRALARFGQ
jgi:hypothetical protein